MASARTVILAGLTYQKSIKRTDWASHIRATKFLRFTFSVNENNKAKRYTSTVPADVLFDILEEAHLVTEE